MRARYAAVGVYTVNVTFPGNASYSQPGAAFPIAGSFFAGTINVSSVAVPTAMTLALLPPASSVSASASPALPTVAKGCHARRVAAAALSAAAIPASRSARPG